MPSRDLPARPDLDHLKAEAKQLKSEFLRGDAGAVARVRAILGPRKALKLTEAQRVIAREYGFSSWPRLRARVQAAGGTAQAVDAFLAAVLNRDAAGAIDVLRAEPRIASTSVHVASVLGHAAEVRRLVAQDATLVSARTGDPPADPLLWLCYSPFHNESVERDDGLADTTRVLLEAGADPNTRDGRYGVPALYAVTGANNAPRIARILLEAGAEPTDGESVFHAAEHFHVQALELLLEYGVQLNATGEWGNTPLYFLLRHWDVARMPRVEQGLGWLLDHGADPNVPCGRERETALHIAVRRGQDSRIVRRLLDHGADVAARTLDGRTAWVLARRGGFAALASLLEEHGARPEELTPADELMAACGRGDAAAARALASPQLVASLDDADVRVLPQAASEDRTEIVLACLAAGFPIDAADENGATALHHAAIHGNASLVRELLRHGADIRIRDRQHGATALGWACFGADHVATPDGDYAGSVKALLDAGARPSATDVEPAHTGVREVLRRYADPGTTELDM